MSDEPADRGQGTPQAGILGNLPHSRPSVRSPRRTTEPPKKQGEQGEKPTAEAEADTEPTADSASAERPEQPVDLEALARGGIAVATEAASLGLRLAGRAAAAVRDAVERR